MPAEPARRPPRVIGFWMAVALVMGNMIGSGIFLLPASLAPFGGLSIVGWLISAGGAVALALVFARLSHLNPAAGGPFAFTRDAFGDLPAFLVAWGYWISMWTSLGALAVAFVGYLDPFLPSLVRTPLAAAALAVAVVWVLVLVNIAGIRAAAWVQAVTTVLKVVPLLAVGLAGSLLFDASHFAVAQADGSAWVRGVPAVVTLTLWAFLGLESATVPAEAIRDPHRTIPRATVTGTVLAALLYILGTVGVMSVLEPSSLGRSTAPFADAARALAGNGAAAAVALGASISCLGALNGWVLLVGQLPMAAAREGLFPPIFARVTARGTPAAGMIVAGALTTALVGMNYTRGLVDLFTFMILLATLNTLIPYVFSSVAVFLLRPASARLTHGVRVAAAAAFLYSFWAIAGAGAESVYYGFLLIIAGLPVYTWLRRHPQGRTGGGSMPAEVRATLE